MNLIYHKTSTNYCFEAASSITEAFFYKVRLSRQLAQLPFHLLTLYYQLVRLSPHNLLILILSKVKRRLSLRMNLLVKQEIVPRNV
jgi:hypothetical protein